MMSQSYIAAVVVILSQVLPLFGISVSVEALNTTMSTLIAIGAGIWIVFHKWKQGVDALGRRTK